MIERTKQHWNRAEQPGEEDRRKSCHASPASLSKTLVAASFVAFPAILFYTILFRNALDIPFLDDYDALLNFLNQITLLTSTSAKASYFLASQHGEYKLFFAHGIAWLLLVLCGHIDFKLLCAIGNGFVLLLAILLWKMFIPDCKDLKTRLAYFIPVSWLLFQLQYWQTLNWAMPGIQNIPVLVFSLGAIYLLVRGEQWAFCCALAFLILAVGSSGNGLIIIPIGVLILALARRRMRVVSWLLVSAVCVAAYAYRYNAMVSSTDPNRSIFAAFHPLSPLYVYAFIGSAGSVPFKAASLFLGIFLFVFFVLIADRGYIRRNPLVSYCVLFLLLTAIGVAGIRSDFGVGQALESRYTIYSVLLLIFAWFAIVEEFLLHRRASLFHNDIFLGAVAAAVLFSLCMDLAGSSGLAGRNSRLVQAMAAFEHTTASNSTKGPSPPILINSDRAASDAFSLRARAILTKSINLGIYRPPPYPSAGVE